MTKKTKQEFKQVILMRIGELFLKGKNRGQFERRLIDNIKYKLRNSNCTLAFERNRYIVSDFLDNDKDLIIKKLLTVFGLSSISIALRVKSDFDLIAKAGLTLVPNKGTFRVTANRGDKTFKLNSMELSRELGGFILDNKKRLKVNLHTPNIELKVDVREEGITYLYTDTILASGGMPTGSAGQGLLLLSGGIDSPVAGYCMAKRGLSLQALHFHSYPYTSVEAKDKVVELRDKLENYCDKIPLMLVPFTKIQEAIQRHCNNNYLITIMRRIMSDIAKRVAIAKGCGCIINGESLGQVASQTLESMAVTNEAVGDFLILRPLVAYDKKDIIEIAKKIETFEISIKPFEDCCTVFLPESPVIKPKVLLCQAEQARIPDLDALIQEAIQGIELID